MPISGSQSALMFALMGVARLGATRMGYVSAQPFIRVNGSVVTGIMVQGVSVTETLGEPTNAEATAYGWTPTEGHEFVLTLGSINAVAPRFAGTILRSHQIYLGAPENVVYKLTLIDHTWGLNRFKVSGHFTGSATTIAETLIATYAPGYTATIEQGLPTVDGGITFTFQDLLAALKNLGERIGAQTRCEYTRDVKLFIPPDTSRSAPQPVTESNPTLMLTPPMDISRDLSSFITRVFHEGGGSLALTTIAVGETILPVADASWYQPSGVVVSGPQRITYTEVQPGGAGTLVGPSAAPVVAPSQVRDTAGSGVEAGVHSWAYTWVTAAGETLPSPIAKATMRTFVTPGAPDSVTDGIERDGIPH